MSKKRAFLMVACCVIGLGAVAAVLLFGVPVNSVLVVLLLLLCLLSHFLMMDSMGHEGAYHQHRDESSLMNLSTDRKKSP